MAHNSFSRPGGSSISTRLAALLLVLILGFLLTACGAFNASEPVSVEPTSPPTAEEPGEQEDPDEPTVPTAPAEATTQVPDATREQDRTAQTEPGADDTSSAPVLPDEPTGEPVTTPEPDDTDTPIAEEPTTTPPEPTSTPFAYPEPDEEDAPADIGSEMLFLRDRVLIAYDMESGEERPIASAVSAFAATPDGRTLALVRNEEDQPHDIWLIERDGSNMQQLTSDNRVEGSLSWAPDGQTLAYASAETDPRPLTWIDWTAWCSSSEVRLLDIESTTVTPLEPGCDPAFSNDGLRIAFATPPNAVAFETEEPVAPGEDNTIRLVNRQGENGWNFAAAGETAESGHLVYAPAWSPDNDQIVYNRFIGYRALTDLNYIEIAGSYQGNGTITGAGAGWMLPPRFAPDGSRMAVIGNNFSSAAGYTGYMTWDIQVFQPGEPGKVILPSGETPTDALLRDRMQQVTAAAWAPDSSAMAVLLPPEWDSGAEVTSESSGDLWLWEPGSAPATNPITPGNAPTEKLVENVDFASPLLWLPAL